LGKVIQELLQPGQFFFRDIYELYPISVVPLVAEGKLDPNHLDPSSDGIRPGFGRKMEAHAEVLPHFQFLREIEQQTAFTGVHGPA